MKCPGELLAPSSPSLSSSSSPREAGTRSIRPNAGVKLRYGAVIGTAQPGLGFKIPLIDSVEKVSVKTIHLSWDKMNSYSYDQQPADLKISVTLRASPEKVADLYAKFGGSTPRSNRWSAPPSTSRSRSCSAATRR